jgi:hypothetical protein
VREEDTLSTYSHFWYRRLGALRGLGGCRRVHRAHVGRCRKLIRLWISRLFLVLVPRQLWKHLFKICLCNYAGAPEANCCVFPR